jgi:hypothetical protein
VPAWVVGVRSGVNRHAAAAALIYCRCGRHAGRSWPGPGDQFGEIITVGSSEPETLHDDQIRANVSMGHCAQNPRSTMVRDVI